METVYADLNDLSSPSSGVPERSLKNISDTDRERALASASSFADSYLGNRYLLPLTSWGDVLRWCVCAIAAYNIIAGRGFNADNGSDEQIRLRYDDAVLWLKNVAKGNVTPPGIIDSSQPPTGTGINGSTRAPQAASNERRGW